MSKILEAHGVVGVCNTNPFIYLFILFADVRVDSREEGAKNNNKSEIG